MTEGQARVALREILGDPCGSESFKNYIRASLKRDPCDVIAELEYASRLYSALLGELIEAISLHH